LVSLLLVVRAAGNQASEGGQDPATSEQAEGVAVVEVLAAVIAESEEAAVVVLLVDEGGHCGHTRNTGADAKQNRQLVRALRVGVLVGGHQREEGEDGREQREHLLSAELVAE